MALAATVLVAGAWLIVSAPSVPPVDAGADDRPDIVVLMLDDTPPEPRLFERMPKVSSYFIDQGTTFTEYYGNDPLCCPGKANFLTGLYAHHHGVTTNDATLFDPRMTVATALRGAGYRTLIAGKYLHRFEHVQDKSPAGWDRSALLGSGGYYEYDLWRDGVREYHASRVEDYSTDVIASAAVEMVRGSPMTRPLFMLVAPFATHARWPTPGDPQLALPAPRHERASRCTGIGRYRTPAFNEADMSDKPAFMRSWPMTERSGWPLVQACRALLSVDQLFNRVRNAVLARGRRTLFVVTADNGIGWGNHRWWSKLVPWTTEMPLYTRWSDAATPRRIDAFVSNIDWAPTIAELAGAELGPYPTGQAGPDGLSLVPLLEGQAAPVRDALLEETRVTAGLVPRAYAFPPWWAIRTTEQDPAGLWHYVEWDDGSTELYDMAADPWRLENLSGDPSVADTEAALASRLGELRTSK